MTLTLLEALRRERLHLGRRPAAGQQRGDREPCDGCEEDTVPVVAAGDEEALPLTDHGPVVGGRGPERGGRFRDFELRDRGDGPDGRTEQLRRRRLGGRLVE